MTNDMTRGNPTKLILYFSIPVLLGNVFQQFYSMVDTIIVGRAINYQALAAVGSTNALSFSILGFASGITSGLAVMTAQLFGAKNEKEMRRSIATSIWICIALSFIMTFFAMIFAKPLLRVMNTPDSLFGYAYSYVIIIFAGISATVAYNMIACILRALGDSKTPLYFLIFSSILNVILDLLFIKSFHMGVEGAAYATIASQFLSALLCILYTAKKYPQLHLKKEDFQLDLPFAWKHLTIGIPMALQFSITGIGLIILQGALNQFTDTYIAGYTAANKVQNIGALAANSFGMTMANYAGQNLGACDFKRIRDGVKTSIIVSMIFCVLSSVTLIVFANPLTSLFISEQATGSVTEIYAASKQYLHMSAYFFPFLYLLLIYRNALQGVGKSFWPMMGGVLELAIRIVTAFTLPRFIGYTGITIIDPMAWVGACLLLFISYHIIMKKLEQIYGKKQDKEYV